MLKIAFILMWALLHLNVTNALSPTSPPWVRRPLEIQNARKLWHYLMNDYDKFLRPVRNQSQALEVNFGVSLQNIFGLDETQEVLYTNVWLNYEWKDFQLTWNLSDFGGVSSVRLDIDQIWSPDIRLYNTHIANEAGSLVNTQAVVYSDGTVSWVPMAHLASACTVDLTRFPYDTQTCLLKWGSWTYDGSKVNVTSRQNTVDISTYDLDSEFNLESYDVARQVVRYQCCPEPYITITATLKLKRRISAITHTVVAPAVAFCLLLPAIFILPPESGDKIKFGVGLLIANVLTLLVLLYSVPLSHLTTPKLALYHLTNIMMCCIAVFISVFIVNIWSKGNRRKRLPDFAKSIILGVCGRITCVQRDDYMPLEDELATSTEDGKSEVEGHQAQTDLDDVRILRKSVQAVAAAEWKQLAIILDRIFFLLFLAVVIIFTLIMAIRY